VRHALLRHDLGEGVIYAVVTRPDLTLLIVNQSEVRRRFRSLLKRVLGARSPIPRQRQPQR
jgi:hypothetical protein